MPHKEFARLNNCKDLWNKQIDETRKRGKIFRKSDYMIEYKYTGSLFGIDYENLAKRVFVAAHLSGLPIIYTNQSKASTVKENPSRDYVTEFENSCDYTETIFGDKKRHHQITTDPNGKVVAYLRDVSPKFAQRFANLLDEHLKGFGAPSVNLPEEEM